MPADPDLTMPASGGFARDLARRLGVTGFWRWWGEQLATLIPSGPRAMMQRRRMRPVLAFDTASATLWKPEAKAGRLAMVEVATIALEGDAPTVVAGGRAALASGSDALQRSSTPPKFIVALPPRTVLRKTIVLPAALEENLRQAVGYDLDRHTPFKADEMYFDVAVVARDPAHNALTVDLAAARRAVVDAAIRHAESWGANVVAVTPEPPGAAYASSLNLLAPERRTVVAPWRRWELWLPIALLGALVVVAMVLPLWQKREYAIALNQLADEARQRAAVSETLRTELDRQAGDFNFALERKYAYPSVLQVLDDVTRMLPDDTWLTQFELKTSRGKETLRELSLRGESANAGRLVTLLEDSKLFAQAAPRSPTTKIQPGPGEIFDVGAQLRPLPPPAVIALVIADRPVATPGAAIATPPASSATQAGQAPSPAGSASAAPAAPGAPGASPSTTSAAPAAAPPPSASAGAAAGNAKSGAPTTPNASATPPTSAEAARQALNSTLGLPGNTPVPPAPVILNAPMVREPPTIKDMGPVIRDAPPPAKR